MGPLLAARAAAPAVAATVLATRRRAKRCLRRCRRHGAAADAVAACARRPRHQQILWRDSCGRGRVTGVAGGPLPRHHRSQRRRQEHVSAAAGARGSAEFRTNPACTASTSPAPTSPRPISPAWPRATRSTSSFRNSPCGKICASARSAANAAGCGSIFSVRRKASPKSRRSSPRCIDELGLDRMRRPRRQYAALWREAPARARPGAGVAAVGAAARRAARRFEPRRARRRQAA